MAANTFYKIENGVIVDTKLWHELSSDERSIWKQERQAAMPALASDEIAAIGPVELIDGEPVQTWSVQKKPPPSIEEIRNETLRRLMLQFSARDQFHLSIKVQDATARGAFLKDKLDREGLTEAEDAEATYLRGATLAYFAIKAAGNALEAKSAADYEDDKHWPILNG